MLGMSWCLESFFPVFDLGIKLPAQFVAVLRSVHSVGRVHTLCGDGDDFVTHVINFIAHEQLHVTGFRTEIPTLEDVFLKLTGRGIRD